MTGMTPAAPAPRWIQSVTLWLAVVALTASSMTARQGAVPWIAVEAPDSLRPVAERVRGFDPERLTAIMRLTGLAELGPSIRVLLLPEESAMAQEAPSWVAAFADAERDLVVLFPARIGTYPYSSLEGVLFHEVAHILVARATDGAPVPRWFNEGLATAAERNWGLGDRSRFAWEVIVGGQLTATELEGLFAQGQRETARAYALANALVRDLLRDYGPAAPARILARMAEGAPFEQALYATTGNSVSRVMSTFWRRHEIWESWISLLGHPFTLWSLITFLALAAIWRHRRRRLERLLQWEREEQAENLDWEEHRRRYRVH